MKTDLKAILFEPGYIDLSEKLRSELELKIVTVYAQKRLDHYVNHQAGRFIDTAETEFLSAYLLSKTQKDQVLSGKLLQGIKTWFHMYHEDRLLVIEKFRTCYQQVIPSKNTNEKPVMTIVFCKFLICELLDVLSESRWQDLVRQDNSHQQLLYN